MHKNKYITCGLTKTNPLMKRLLLLSVVFIVAFSSCKKKDDNKDCKLSEVTLAGSYKISAVKYQTSPTAPQVDFFDQFVEPCAKDDILTINANHTYVYQDAGTTCNPNGSESGNWSLSGNNITIDGDTGTVENFSCTGFTLTQTNALTTGDKILATYTKQ